MMYENEILRLIQKYPSLVTLKERKVKVETPDLKEGTIVGFSSIAGDLDVKIANEEGSYNYYTAFSSKKDGSLYFGYSFKPRKVWKVGTKTYSDETFHHNFDILNLK